jgi:hypothetical protein
MSLEEELFNISQGRHTRTQRETADLVKRQKILREITAQSLYCIFHGKGRIGQTG